MSEQLYFVLVEPTNELKTQGLTAAWCAHKTRIEHGKKNHAVNYVPIAKFDEALAMKLHKIGKVSHFKKLKMIYEAGLMPDKYALDIGLIDEIEEDVVAILPQPEPGEEPQSDPEPEPVWQAESGDTKDLETLSRPELLEMVKEKGITGADRKKKSELIELIQG